MVNNYLIFGGVKSSDYGIYISGEGVFDAPKRDAEMISIPGRNGAFALDHGRFENITVTYPAHCYEETYELFTATIDSFRNAITAKTGYQQLTDTFHPDEFRMGAFISGLEVDPILYNSGAKFNITFECKPQRYLTSGQQRTVIGVWGNTETATGSVVEFDNDCVKAIKSAEVAVVPQQDTSSGAPSPSNPCAISGSSSVEIYDDGKYGGSIEWNQNVAYYSGNKATISSNTGATTVTGDGTATYMGVVLKDGVSHNYVYQSGHKYFYTVKLANITVSNLNKFYFTSVTNGDISTTSTPGVYSGIFTLSSSTAISLNASRTGGTNTTTSDVFDIDYLNTIDLTQCFGATKADEIYAMEQQTAGSGAAYVKNLFYKDYYAYEAGTVTCVSAVNGDSYTHTTLSLGTTVYGGTVNVTTGAGTVEYGAFILNGTQSISAVGADSFRYYNSDIADGDFTSDPNVISTWLENKASSENVLSFSQSGASGNHNIYIWKATSLTGVTDVDSFKTYLSNNPLTVVYKKATPTTLSLTGTQVDTIQGVNYVWSPQETLTLEIGDDPDFIVNPTLFGCGPLIEAKGYGDITFNGHTISLANGAIGTVHLWSRATYGFSTSGTLERSFSTALFEPTDTFSVEVTDWFGLFETSPSISNTNADAINSSTTNIDSSVTYGIDLLSLFTVGTSSTKTNTSTYTFGSKKVIVDMTIAYDKTTGTVTYTVATSTVNNPSFASPNYSGFMIEACDATSTLNSLGNPTYIDCDLGETYKIKDGQVVSLNGNVDLGSDLPTLASGPNEITYDNTFTEVAVTPRWWTV